MIIQEYLENENLKKTLFFSGVYLIALLLSLFFAPFVYVCALIGLVGVCLLPVNYIFCFLLFAFPYANLVASNVESTSLYILVEMAAICAVLLRGGVWELVKPAVQALGTSLRSKRGVKTACVDVVKAGIAGVERLIKLPVLYLLVGLLVIALVTADSLFDLKYLIILVKILVLFCLFVGSFRKEYVRYYSHFFLLGMMTSSVLGLFKTQIPRLLSFFTDLNYEEINGTLIPRFSGINTDPNHYAIPLMLCICICLFSLANKNMKSKAIWGVLAVVFMLLGFITMSKSFFLLLIATIFIMMCTFVPKEKIRKVYPVVLIAIVAALVIPNPITSSILYRFQNLTSTNVSALNGREAIWYSYIVTIFESVHGFLFGHGLQAGLVNKRASHNIFLEATYRMGLTGMLCWLGVIVTVVKSGLPQRKRNLINFWGFVLLVIQYCLLSGLTVYDYAYYLMICYVFYAVDLKNNEAIA